jgi:glycerol-3-phosphate dehydrogenase (NAD(P)+)
MTPNPIDPNGEAPREHDPEKGAKPSGDQSFDLSGNLPPIPAVETATSRPFPPFCAPKTPVNNLPISPEWGNKVLMLGGGSYGTAISHRLAGDDVDVLMWDRNGESVHSINTQHTNPRYLKNFLLSESLRATQSLKVGMLDRGIIVVALPSQALPQVLPHLRPHPDSLIISLTKGFIIEGWDPQKDPHQLLTGPPEGARVLTPMEYYKTLEGWSDVKNVVAVAGPGFAKNILSGCRFGLTAASHSEEAARRASYLLTGDNLRVQTSLDPVGVEIAAAMKNVIAIAIGVVQGLKNQDGSPRYGIEEIEFVKAKGMEEMMRLSKHFGGRYRTLHTFAGWADLNLTTASTDSRNNRLGRELAAGGKLLDIVAQLGQTAEGIYAAWGAKRLTDPRRVGDGWVPGIRMDLTNALIDIVQEYQKPSRIIDVFFKQNQDSPNFGGTDDPFVDRPFPHLH